MHARTSLVFAFFALNFACSPPAPEMPISTVTYVSPTLGIVFSLPADWIQASQTGGEIFSGPRGTDAFYTTIALQSRRTALKLDEALESEFQPLATSRHFSMDRRGPEVVDGQAGLAYTVQFEMQEMPRRRTGVLFGLNGSIIDLSYNAPSALFLACIPAFQGALDSLVLAPPTQNPAGVGPPL